MDELLAGLEAAAEKPIGEHLMDKARAAIAQLKRISARLKAKVNAVTAKKEKATLDEAREIMGREFLGPEAAEKTWGRKLKPEKIPAIPFSKEELVKANELGQFLELRVDKDNEGKGLTMQHQNELLKERFAKEGKGQLLYDIGWYRQEEFFTEDTPELQWVLVTKDVIPGSTGKNAVAQTRVIADYVRNVVFKDQEIQGEYAGALKEFDEQEVEITKLMAIDWRECNRRLSALRLNQMCRRTPSEAMFDTENHLDSTGERLLLYMYDRTQRFSSDGYLVNIGHADSAGALVNRWYPEDGAYPPIGVVFSRSR